MNNNILRAIQKLKDLKIPYRLLEFPAVARTSQDVVRMGDVDPREIIKTLMVKTSDGRVYALMLPGIMKVDNKKVRKLLKSKKLRMLNKDELKENTPFVPGEVCPIIIEKIPIYIDKRSFETEKVNFGSGDLYFGIEINSKDIKKCIKGKIVDIAVE
jgi:Cys-tRNA(Pro) deacylase